MGCLLVWCKILKISEHESEGHRTEVIGVQLPGTKMGNDRAGHR